MHQLSSHLASRARPDDDGRPRSSASLVPPRQFAHASLENYVPDPEYPSQAEAVAKVRAFAAAWKSSGGLFSRRRAVETKPGLYLDGGFGVGKTHLLAALWSLAPGRKYFGTFIEYTALVGALGYAATVAPAERREPASRSTSSSSTTRATP